MRKRSLPEPFEKLVQEAKELNQLLSDEARAEQVAMTPQSAERPIRKNRIDRNDIIMGLADIARTGKSDGARVSALNNLAEIFLLKAKFIDPKDKFDGWTVDELRDFAVKHIIPERFKSLMGSGRNDIINDIIMELDDIARTSKSEGARVRALNSLAEIYRLKAKSTKDIRKFYGWTTDELKDYAVNCVIPERFRSLLGPSGLHEETATLRGDKHGGRPI